MQKHSLLDRGLNCLARLPSLAEAHRELASLFPISTSEPALFPGSACSHLPPGTFQALSLDSMPHAGCHL